MILLPLLLKPVQVPLPTWSTLSAIQVADRRARFPAEPSWTTVHEAKAFGVADQPGESRYRYRISPDRDATDYPGSPPIAESYLDGFPVWATHANGNEGPARPLGFVYAEDGYPTNAKVSLKTADGWTTPRLTRRGIASLILPLVLLEKEDTKSPLDRPNPHLLWFKVVAGGYGTYTYYKDLTVIEPKGHRRRLLSTTRDVIEDVLQGNWNDEPTDESKP